MRRLKQARPSPAVVVAIVALIAALAGTAVAQDATTSAVSKKKVKKISKKQAKKYFDANIGNASVANATNAENAQTAENANQLGGLGPESFLQKPVRRVQEISANTTAAGQFRNVTASCPSGERAIAGGGAWTTTIGNVTGVNKLIGTRPVPADPGDDTTTGWQAYGTSDSALTRQIRAYAICVPE